MVVFKRQLFPPGVPFLLQGIQAKQINYSILAMSRRQQNIPSVGPLRYWYNRAQSIDLEFAASAFWQTLLQLQFPLLGYSVIGEQSPDNNSRRRIDVTVFYHEDEDDTTATLLLVEIKRRGHANVNTVEEQAQRGAGIHLESSQADVVYVLTTWGTRARVWYVRRAEPDQLQPLFGGAAGQRRDYVEINSAAGTMIYNGFRYMRGEIEFEDIVPV